ncbi:hypothetical protein [Olivibacter domesticus]|uniref:hypothetical protein n=1 Tax=Olivibacter domesticus TaxID=407022 RepID=UPI000B8A3B67|nr:hypothetical protein [Olivibacter domesticus]
MPTYLLIVVPVFISYFNLFVFLNGAFPYQLPTLFDILSGFFQILIRFSPDKSGQDLAGSGQYLVNGHICLEVDTNLIQILCAKRANFLLLGSTQAARCFGWLVPLQSVADIPGRKRSHAQT